MDDRLLASGGRVRASRCEPRRTSSPSSARPRPPPPRSPAARPGARARRRGFAGHHHAEIDALLEKLARGRRRSSWTTTRRTTSRRPRPSAPPSRRRAPPPRRRSPLAQERSGAGGRDGPPRVQTSAACGCPSADAQAPAVVRAALVRDAGAVHAHRARRRRRDARRRHRASVQYVTPKRSSEPDEADGDQSKTKLPPSGIPEPDVATGAALYAEFSHGETTRTCRTRAAGVRAAVPPHTGGTAQEVRVQPRGERVGDEWSLWKPVDGWARVGSPRSWSRSAGRSSRFARSSRRGRSPRRRATRRDARRARWRLRAGANGLPRTRRRSNSR